MRRNQTGQGVIEGLMDVREVDRGKHGQIGPGRTQADIGLALAHHARLADQAVDGEVHQPLRAVGVDGAVHDHAVGTGDGVQTDGFHAWRSP
jgi:hypothetical protein